MAPLRHLGAKMLAGRRPAANGEPSMGEITTIGLDLAKHVFQVQATTFSYRRRTSSWAAARM
jgi:hypothetical protein